MAPLALEHAAEEISNHHQETSAKMPRRRREQIAYDECSSKAILSSLASGLIGFSAGYAVQVGGRRYLPGFIKSYYLIPVFLAAYVPTVTANYLITRCKAQYRSQPKVYPAIRH